MSGVAEPEPPAAPHRIALFAKKRENNHASHA